MSVSEYLDTLHGIPTPMHFVEHARARLSKAGYVELDESADWENIPKKFYVIRQARSIIAFNITSTASGVILVSHSDSPCFKVKPNPSDIAAGTDTLNVAPYGSGIWYSWLDRDLRIAGSITYRKPDGNKSSRLLTSPSPVAVIPSLAIHLNSGSGLKPKFNIQTNFSPLLSLHRVTREGDPLFNLISELTKVEKDQICEFDLSVVDSQPPSIVGVDNSLIAGSQISSHLPCLSSLSAFLSVDKPADGLICLAIFDNEETENNTICGSESNFLPSVLKRINAPRTFYAKSLIITANGVNGLHPNFQSESEGAHPVKLGEGPAYAWNQRELFTTEKTALIKIKSIAKSEKIPIVPYIFPNDKRPDPSMGPHLNASLGIQTVELGIPILGTNSIRELASLKDLEQFEKLLCAVLSHTHLN